VFVDTEKSRAVERAERLRASIADADFCGLHAPVASAEEVRISASIGVARFPVDAQSPEALLEKVDEAMYHSKKTGRNGVRFRSRYGTRSRRPRYRRPHCRSTTRMTNDRMAAWS
jgi:diguanylate cyclase (GGDEF)-like protein